MLCGQKKGYKLNATAFKYMEEYKLPEFERNHPCQFFDSKAQWDKHL